MQKDALAQDLRQRQHQLGQVPAEMIDALSDDAIIDSYITCSCCGEKQVTRRQLRKAMFLARDADGFFDVCDQFGKRHA